MEHQQEPVDLFVIGGGINGVGIARDAVGRGLSVTLAEMGDLASATSSASTKMFHGGLRYLEYFEVGLVRKALIEREVLLSAMPHISWPMRFVLPYHKDQRFEGETPTSKLMNIVMPWMRGRRPAWLIRLGLFMYDNLGGRKILPATRTVDLKSDPVGAPLKEKYAKAFEYSDCWVEDSRLVVLNARDAELRGAQIWIRTKVTRAERVGDLWEITTESAVGEKITKARMIVNSGGPWVGDIIRKVAHFNSTAGVRLVRGSHIVTGKLFDHDKGYFFQGTDGRIIFAIPYESDFTLIGTTDKDHGDADITPECTDEERDYLCRFASEYFKRPVSADDVVWSYSGVRPLYDDGASSASAATRDYVLTVNQTGGAPILNVFGGKITTYRKLAEHALAEIAPFFPGLTGDWTAGVALPGGDFPVDGVAVLISDLQISYPFLNDFTVKRLVRAYGTNARKMLGDAETSADLGQDFGVGLMQNEVRWLMQNEYAQRAEDVVWRRNKLGLRMTKRQIAVLDDWMQAQAE
ncbi:MAG: glycerol-3-phosphate dehydrogenase [Rhodobacteraceae bacterium]|nr:glycerol-3-phosphate dehydrogenase [Paracoccaceae bacterium]